MVYLVVHMLSIFHSYNRWYHLHKDVQQAKKMETGRTTRFFFSTSFHSFLTLSFLLGTLRTQLLTGLFGGEGAIGGGNKLWRVWQAKVETASWTNTRIGLDGGGGCVFRSCDISVGLQDLCADVLLLFPKGPSVNKRAGSVARQVTVRLLSWIWGWCLVAGKPLQPTCHEIIIMCLFCLTETWEGVQYIG